MLVSRKTQHTAELGCAMHDPNGRGQRRVFPSSDFVSFRERADSRTWISCQAKMPAYSEAVTDR